MLYRSMTGLLCGLGKSDDECSNLLRGSSLGMNEHHTTDWYGIAQKQLSGVALAVQQHGKLDLNALSALAVQIAGELKRSDQLLIQAMSGPAGPPLITNLVNVAILATTVGARLGYHGTELDRLTFAGLLHDIGLFAVPQSLITKSSRLTHDERILIEQHPELGYQTIRKAGQEYDWLAQVVRQAHERWNGQGYPNKLNGRQICEFSQIIGVVDIFDALVSPRGYRRRFFPHEAVRELIVAERTAFPREVVKALVEQLSAYPLGTSVRLTTGEVGAVIRVNPRYPLRPVVWIEGDVAYGQERRQLDLSRTPLVTIVETLAPPDVARASVHSNETQVRTPDVVPSASDQFTSLLEGLDALASAIQGAVESRASVQDDEAVACSDEHRGRDQHSVQGAADISFEKEVIGLFALEAHEWLAQIQTAVRQLAEGAKGAARPKLYGILLQGITNLAKSASTVELQTIAQMASNLLPILHDVRRPEPRAIAAALQSLQEGLDRISLAVRALAGGRVDEPAVNDNIPVETVSDSLQAFPAPATKPLVGSQLQGQPPRATLIQALRGLQQARARSTQPVRDVLEAVIQRAEQEADLLDVAGVGRILTELDRLDDAFLQEVHRRVPIISSTLMQLRTSGPTHVVSVSQLDPILKQIEALYDLASQVQATMIMMFLHGLQSFLTIAAYRNNSTIAQRLERVEARIHALIPMTEQWRNIGRVERSAISEILAV